MSEYRVIITPAAIDAIAGCRDYIARESGSPEVAVRWVKRVIERLYGLSTLPQKFELAPEDHFRPFEIRRTVIGKYVATYAVDETYRVVRVIGFRHGSRLPRPDDLPSDPGTSAG